jgi:ubiquitin-conjugating enzyme E2 variant
MARTRERSQAVAALDLASILAFAALWLALLGSLAAVPPLAWWPALAGVAALGWLASDAATGLVHWIGDRCFEETTPLLGPLLIQPFREHHRDPLAITRHGFCEVNGSNALAMCPLLALSLPLGAHFGVSLLPSLVLAFVAALAGAVSATNQLHCWAHAPHAPRPVRWLQRRRLVLSPAAHALHHRGAHDRAFCVTSGWLNAWLDRTHAFARLGRRLGLAPVAAPVPISRSRNPRRSDTGPSASGVAEFPMARGRGA